MFIKIATKITQIANVIAKIAKNITNIATKIKDIAKNSHSDHIYSHDDLKKGIKLTKIAKMFTDMGTMIRKETTIITKQPQ